MKVFAKILGGLALAIMVYLGYRKSIWIIAAEIAFALKVSYLLPIVGLILFIIGYLMYSFLDWVDEILF